MQRLMIKSILTLGLLLPIGVQAMTVQYFGLTTLLPTQNTLGARVCLLDRSEHLKKVINAGMSKQMAIRDMNKAAIIQRYSGQFKALSKSTVCQFEAAKLEVMKLPAIVINHQYVIYGQQNITAAVHEYKAYLECCHVE